MRKGMEIMIKLIAVSASLVKPSFFKYLDSNWVILSLKSNKTIYFMNNGTSLLQQYPMPKEIL